MTTNSLTSLTLGGIDGVAKFTIPSTMTQLTLNSNNGNASNSYGGTASTIYVSSNSGVGYQGKLSGGNAGKFTLVKSGSGVINLAGTNTYTRRHADHRRHDCPGDRQRPAHHDHPDDQRAICDVDDEPVGPIAVQPDAYRPRAGRLGHGGHQSLVNTAAGGYVTSATPTLTSNNLDLRSGTVNVLLGGTGGLNKTTATTTTFPNYVVLNQANTYSGATQITTGGVVLGVANAIPAASNLTINGATAVLDMGTFANSAGTLTVDNGGRLLSTTGVLTPSGTMTLNSGFITAILAGSGSYSKSGSGTLYLGGVNTFTGTGTISNGTVMLGNAAGLGAVANAATVTSTGAIDIAGLTVGAKPLTISGSGTRQRGTDQQPELRWRPTAQWGGTVTLAGNAAVGGSNVLYIQGAINNGGAYTLTKLGQGETILTTNATGTAWTGGTILSAGTLRIAAPAPPAAARSISPPPQPPTPAS